MSSLDARVQPNNVRLGEQKDASSPKSTARQTERSGRVGLRAAAGEARGKESMDPGPASSALLHAAQPRAAGEERREARRARVPASDTAWIVRSGAVTELRQRRSCDGGRAFTSDGAQP
ncbi:unnamed protein product [Prorocentrum cordatum]|uniref:Uncharacterized protein n=1 Tax=Prorocentrum cordatum TaxID=2364126 RepID=A0ABN9YH57_9DINO|nr:unnamed protein product [Polarella glacialis]